MFGADPSAGKQETLSGTVEHIVFRSEESGYTVLELSQGEERITVVGELPGVAAGEDVTFTGAYTSHPTYGQQFRAEFCEQRLPATTAAIRKYLSGGAIKGIGPRTAERIVGKFGDQALAVIEREPERLAEISGISRAKAAEIGENYQRIFGLRSVMLQLARFRIEPSAAIRAWKRWGPLAGEVVAEDPYKLCIEEIGVSFEKADQIALELNLDETAPARLRAGALHVLTHNLRNGHTCLPRDKLISTAVTLLEVDRHLLEDALDAAVSDGELLLSALDGVPFLYLPAYYEAEAGIAERIGMMLCAAPPAAGSFDHEISQLELELGIRYAALQRKAIGMALANQAFILTGGPGTGKTTTLNAILSILERDGGKVVLAAPTGRAAKRMCEVTGREAKTIHRLLEVDFRNGMERVKFKRNEKNPLRADTVILDEASMADVLLLYSLIRAMKPGCRLVLVGDPDQLPSVGPGNLLGDLISGGLTPAVHLDEIFRQARQSQIVNSAHRIVRGELPDLSARDGDFFFLQKSSYEGIAETVCGLCADRLPRAYGYSPLADIQVIAPSRVGGLGVVELNKKLQEHLNPPAPGRIEQRFGPVTFREGDKVMQVRNNYDIVWKKEDGEEGAGIFNGDIGIIAMIDRPSRSMMIRYDDREAVYTFEMANELEHAYAITVHKSQGSEFEAVIMPLMSYHPKLYYRNILYTGVTRARRIMILLGQPDTVRRMVENNRKVLRYTGLRHLLNECVNTLGGGGV